MQNCRHIGGIGQGPAGHQAREGVFNIEPAGFSFPEGGEEGAMRRAGPCGCEVPIAKSGPNEQGVPPLTLGHRGQRQVLGRESFHALRLGLPPADHVVGG